MNLENFNVRELNAQEKQEIEGGFLAALLFAAAFIIVGLMMQANPDRVTVVID
jgi:hypothetical protein